MDYGDAVFTFSPRQDEVERYARLDGCYGIRSNAAPDRQSAQDLRERYKELKYVEQAFRTTKTTDIQTRSIATSTNCGCAATCFACFLAYRVMWELRQRLVRVLERNRNIKRCQAGSLTGVWRELFGVTVGKIRTGGATHFKLSHITPYLRKLLTLCQVPSLEPILSAEIPPNPRQKERTVPKTATQLSEKNDPCASLARFLAVCDAAGGPGLV